MARTGVRCEILETKTRTEIANLFGNIKAAYNNLKIYDAEINIFTFRRAMALDDCRLDDIEAIERIWAAYRLKHNYQDGELDYDPDHPPAAMRRAQRRTRRGLLVEIEETPVGSAEDFEKAEFW